MSYYSLLETLTPRRSVYVISDSQYKDIQQKRAQSEIDELEQEVLVQETYVKRIKQRIADLQKEHGLLPPAEE